MTESFLNKVIDPLFQKSYFMKVIRQLDPCMLFSSSHNFLKFDHSVFKHHLYFPIFMSFPRFSLLYEIVYAGKLDLL